MQDGRRLGVRTSNDAEREIVAALEADDWEVLKRGWPDFVATRGSEVRFIEVKPSPDRTFSPNQRRVAEILSRFGIQVELVTP
jgi:Holliday junction resolvase